MDKFFKICDPLYDYIYLSPEEKSLVNHFSFQRLRAIRQLGFSEQTFPSGTHNRFSHSLGVCHLAGKAFDSVFEKNKWPLSEAKKQLFRRALKISALLHDIGHGPLSHSSESLMPPLKNLGLEKLLSANFKRSARHEDYSLKLIMKDPWLYKSIQNTGVEPEAIARILHPEFKLKSDFFKEEGLDFLPLLRQIINSDFDVDRMDYLCRDSLFCGVKYGLIDFIWLISHFDSHIEGGQVFLAIRKGALYTLESLSLGRQHMRLIIYFHHKSVVYNQMLKNYSRDCGWSLPADISSYIRWTDSKLFEKLKSDTNIWAKRITEQKPYLRFYESIFFESSKAKNVDLLKQQLKKEGIDFISMDSEKHSIKPPKNILPKYSVYLKDTSNKTLALDKSTMFLTLPTRKIQRLYVPPEQLSKALPLLKSLKI